MITQPIASPLPLGEGQGEGNRGAGDEHARWPGIAAATEWDLQVAWELCPELRQRMAYPEAVRDPLIRYGLARVGLARRRRLAREAV